MTNDIIEIAKRTSAIITDTHVVYTSGKHGSVYINKDAIYPHTELVSMIGEMFAEKAKNIEVDVVAAPALGGIVLSQWTAYHLSKIKGKEVLSVYTEKTSDNNQIFTRGYDALIRGKNILIIEDLTNTGGSVRKVIASVLGTQGKIAGVGVMINRRPDDVNEKTLGFPFFSLGILEAEAWPEEECIFCKNNVPINTMVGHGKKYLQSKKK